MSTPRTDEVETANKFPGSTEYYAMVVHARALERELTALTAERDQLRADAASQRLHGGLIFRLTAEVERLKGMASWAHICIHHTDAERKAGVGCPCCAVARAVVKLDAELAKERARLDSGTILLTVSGERVWVCGVDLRAAIDAAMKEDTK
jgi:hypothetical protein